MKINDVIQAKFEWFGEGGQCSYVVRWKQMRPVYNMEAKRVRGWFYPMAQLACPRHSVEKVAWWFWFWLDQMVSFRADGFRNMLEEALGREKRSLIWCFTLRNNGWIPLSGGVRAVALLFRNELLQFKHRYFLTWSDSGCDILATRPSESWILFRCAFRAVRCRLLELK